MHHLKSSHHFHLPHLSIHAAQLELSRVQSEADELIQDIEAHARGEQWELSPTPDSHELAQFWDGVVQDLHDDPTWIQFDDE